jgi:hypothetical protein
VVDEHCALLGHYAASSTDVSGLPTGPTFKVQRTDRFSILDPILSSSKKFPKLPDLLWDPSSLLLSAFWGGSFHWANLAGAGS